MKKKVVALLCVASMAVSLLAGCSSKEKTPQDTQAETKTESSTAVSGESEKTAEKKDPVTLTYWYRNNVGEQEYTQQVEDKLNEILASTEGYEHITVDLHPCKDYSTDLSLALSAGEQIDIISFPGAGSEAELVSDGIVLPLDDYIAANPEISAELPDWLMNMGKFDGVTYYIPNYQQVSNEFYFYTNKEAFEASDYDYDQVQQALYNRDYDFLEKFLEDVLVASKDTIKKDHPDTTYIRGDLGNVRFFVEAGQTGFPSIGGNACFYWDFDKEEINFSDLREDAQDAFRQNAKWYEEGLTVPDPLTNPEPYQNGILGEYSEINGLIQSFGTAEMVMANMNSNQDYVAKNGEIMVWKLDDHNVIGLRNAAQGVGISATSKHPEDAANFLALLFNSKYGEFYNTLCYGLEGIHYNVIKDGIIETTEFTGTQGGADTTYCYWKWVGGNTFNAWLNQSMTPEQKDYILNDLNESTDNLVCPLGGLVFDLKPIDAELTQLRSIFSEYHDSILGGLKGADQEAYMQEYFKKMEAAGLNKVLDELNAQAKAYLASK